MVRQGRLILALLVTVACTQTAGRGPLSADRLVCDFGVVPDSTTVLENSFTLTNTGRDSLHILRVQSSCGCTTAELSARDLAPGQRASLRTVLSMGTFVDHVDKTVSVYVAGQTEPLVLHLVADKERNLADPGRYPYAPDGPARFSLQSFFAGYVAQGESREVSLLVYNHSDQPLKLRRKSRLPRHVRLQLPRTVAPGSIGRLTATFDMRRASDLFGEYGHEVLLSDGLGHRIPLQLYCIVTENFIAEKGPYARLTVPVFALRVLESDLGETPVEKTFRLMNTGRAPLCIRRIQLSVEKGAQARLDPEIIAPGEEGLLTLTLQPELLERGVECGITVNDPKQPYAVLSVLPPL